MKIYTFNDKVLTRNTKWLKEYEEPTPPTPSLPPYTIRMKFTEGVTPSFSNGTRSQVSSSPNVWDLTYENIDWSYLIMNQIYLIEVIGANTTGVTNMLYLFKGCNALTSVPLFDTSEVTNMSSMFEGCTSLTSVPLFDTSEVTSMSAMFYNCSSLTSLPLFNTSKVISISQMFYGCTSLTSVPLFDTSNVTGMNSTFKNCSSLIAVPLINTSKLYDMGSAFESCYNVQSGALALYQQASTQATPPLGHSKTFTNCGRDTVTGVAELAQIPSNWGGTAS